MEVRGADDLSHRGQNSQPRARSPATHNSALTASADSRGRAQDPQPGHTHTHSLSPVAQGHLGGLYGTDHKQKFCKLNPTFPTTHSTRFRVAPTYDWF